MESQAAKPSSAARFSEDGAYRYHLTRLWNDELPALGWLMLNPSKAGALDGDLTVCKVVGFSQRFGYGSSEVANMFAYVETDSDAFAEKAARGVDVVGPENDVYVEAMIATLPKVVVAWGASGRFPGKQARVAEVRAMFERYGQTPYCLGVTAGGEPRHPSRLAYATELQEYTWPK